MEHTKKIFKKKIKKIILCFQFLFGFRAQFNNSSRRLCLRDEGHGRSHISRRINSGPTLFKKHISCFPEYESY